MNFFQKKASELKKIIKNCPCFSSPAQTPHGLYPNIWNYEPLFLLLPESCEQHAGKNNSKISKKITQNFYDIADDKNGGGGGGGYGGGDNNDDCSSS